MSVPRFADFERILFFTGAGLSAESGIPTYRGKGGVWSEYDYEDYACQRAFDRDPDKVWDFHDKRRGAVGKCEPNDGHRIIAEVQKSKKGASVVTQNIDGLHQRSGATDVVELHGSLWRVRCDRDGLVRDDASVPMSPRKHDCGAYWRPDIVWFEDSLDERVLERAHRLLAACDLLVSVGTSGVVYPAADLPRIAMRNGAVSVEINLDDTPVSALYQHQLRGTASDLLRAMSL
ncbi:MAG: NAD-dependent deacylase [Labilithrix sp.]|nr:NAD-dependent deacylase [Labilithrix sp.]